VVKIMMPRLAPVFIIFRASICAEPAITMHDQVVLCQTLIPALTLRAPTIKEKGKSPIHKGITALMPRKIVAFLLITILRRPYDFHQWV
jgi:hypothetical protein